MIIHTHSKLHTDVTNVCFVCSVCSRLVPIDDYIFTFTFMHLADAFIQSDLQLYSGYTFSVVHGIPGNRTHNLLCCWCNALPLSHTGTFCTFDYIVYQRSHRLAIGQYEKWAYCPTLGCSGVCRNTRTYMCINTLHIPGVSNSWFLEGHSPAELMPRSRQPVFFQPSSCESALERQSNPWLPTRELVLDRCTPSSTLWRHIAHETTMAAPMD